MKSTPYLIAEIGLNHLGKENYATEYLDNLLKTKIDGITFQVRKNKMTLKKIFYQNALRKVRRKKKFFGIAICDEKMVDFFSNLEIDFFKIIERDLIKKKLVKKIFNSSVKQVFVSTGKSKSLDLKKHLSYLNNNQKKKLIFIHTKFTDDIRKINLKSIPYIKKRFKTKVAFGSHCSDTVSYHLSLAFEPHSLFFYVRGIKKIIYPDHKHAILLDNVKNFVNYLKKIQLSLGNYNK